MILTPSILKPTTSAMTKSQIRSCYKCKDLSHLRKDYPVRKCPHLGHDETNCQHVDGDEQQSTPVQDSEPITASSTATIVENRAPNDLESPLLEGGDVNDKSPQMNGNDKQQLQQQADQISSGGCAGDNDLISPNTEQSNTSEVAELMSIVYNASFYQAYKEGANDLTRPLDKETDQAMDHGLCTESKKQHLYQSLSSTEGEAEDGEI
ncbi:unnamed protein product [Sphagnum troendelagicum]|uniref:CCHC-type domain-containing protein n=1 Tax=Sphagnum troendelagicum TaxID=128251 RepID=A0ABP0T6S9_9BRYO